MRRKSVLTGVVLALACMSFQVHAHSPMDNAQAGDMASLVDQSNLIFLGKAAKIEYRNAHGDKGEGTIPYTIVTYRINKVLRGKAPGDEITLRIVGGPDGSGRFLTATGVPIMQAGDQDLLFIGDTADPSCPLVFCEHGRFRVLNERVYDTFGSPVRAISKAKVLSRGLPPKEFRTLRFPAPKFDDLMRNPAVAEQLKAQQMPIEVARRRYEAEAPKFVELADEYPSPEKLGDGRKGERPGTQVEERVEALPLAQFLAETQRLATLSKRKPGEVKSIDPQAEIVVAKIGTSVPQRSAPPRLKPRLDDEFRAYQRNDDNPVIRK
jgi:hypothetical protein